MVTDVIEYVRRYKCTFNIANLNSTHNTGRKHRSEPYQLFRQNIGLSLIEFDP